MAFGEAYNVLPRAAGTDPIEFLVLESVEIDRKDLERQPVSVEEQLAAA